MEDISLHILDVVENSVAAGARSIEIAIIENENEGRLELVISDDGKGMNEALLSKVLDPFVTTRTTRRVGLGLSLLAQAARETGGDIEVESETGGGTTVKARFMLDHIDLKPLGDVTKTMEALVAGNPAVDFRLQYRCGDVEEVFDSGAGSSAAPPA